jgi:hypothetical protein
VDADLDTLVTALYVKIDDALAEDRRPGHPARLTQSELVCLAAAQALLGFHSEHRWIRFAICHLRGCFPYLPNQAGYNKRLRAALPLIKQMIRDLAADSDFWFDNVWIADSTPVECGRFASRRSPELADWGHPLEPSAQPTMVRIHHLSPRNPQVRPGTVSQFWCVE